VNEQGPLPAEGTRGREVRDRDRAFMRRMTRAQLRIMHATGGRLLARMGGHPVLALTTTGWRSGRDFSTPVIGIADGDDWLIVASHGGAVSNPRWLRNVVSNPRVKVKVGTGEPVTMRACILPPRERAEWWPRLTGAYPAYATMQSRTDRELAVVRLTPDGRET
jgi:F420H(2)-dependent quinone reductase